MVFLKNNAIQNSEFRTQNSEFARVLSVAFVLLSGCASPPEPLPPPPYGSVRVAAHASTPIDSFTIRLDDLLQGTFANPCTLTYVVAGTHKLTVQDSAGARADTMVAVRQDALSSSLVSLTHVGPFLGNEAPNFSAKDIDGRNFELAIHRGKVVFLSFFEYT